MHVRKTMLAAEKADIGIALEQEHAEKLAKQRVQERINLRKSSKVPSIKSNDGSSSEQKDWHEKRDMQKKMSDLHLKSNISTMQGQTDTKYSEDIQRDRTKLRVEAKLRHKRVKKQFGTVIDRIKILNRLGTQWDSWGADDVIQNSNNNLADSAQEAGESVHRTASPVTRQENSDEAWWDKGAETNATAPDALTAVGQVYNTEQEEEEEKEEQEEDEEKEEQDDDDDSEDD